MFFLGLFGERGEVKRGRPPQAHNFAIHTTQPDSEVACQPLTFVCYYSELRNKPTHKLLTFQLLPLCLISVLCAGMFEYLACASKVADLNFCASHSPTFIMYFKLITGAVDYLLLHIQGTIKKLSFSFNPGHGQCSPCCHGKGQRFPLAPIKLDPTHSI